MQNAARFAASLPGNNALLYGERGTGKSSTVKALLNEFGDHGLRLIEVPKEHLDDFHAMNEVYAKHVGEQPPARATVEVAKLPSGALVELEAVALL